MKKITFLTVLTVFSVSIFAQQKDTTGFVFTTVKESKITSIKNQNRSSTCWAFSGIGFLEAELLRLGKGEQDFSEMFVVTNSMLDRATNYVRLHGESSFSPGGCFYDVLYCWKNYGIVPQTVMPGIMYGDTLPVHNEIDIVAKAYIDAVAKGSFSKLTPSWKNGLAGVYAAYLGEIPNNFIFNGKKYTPKSYADSFGLNMDDYLSFTSFSHHPFHTTFAVEVPDNWRMGQSYNVPIDELLAIIDNAIDNGYTVAWASDVSETGFTRGGIAVVPDADKGAEITGSDMARWTGLSVQDKKAELTSRPLPEIEITQELRQKAYDNWETTDDHGMLIYGIAKDQNGSPYYLVKNSWGLAGKYKGIWYASKAFVAYKTLNIIVHKNSIPKDIQKKLGIK
ncbi:MAG: aminopeptidase [Prevotellaceae bacterium]|jgi:aminopeptidase C|nr:aminopeptidase [Prevotellaceae bacterium]